MRMAGDVVVCAGLTEAVPGGRRNTALCVSGDGILGVHHKVHLPPAERFAYEPGETFAAFDTPVGRLGMLVCYDKLFPEAARALALDGAEAIASLAAWPVDRHTPARRIAADRQVRHFDAIDVARAIENQAYVVAANRVGSGGGLDYAGDSVVYGPFGEELAIAADTGAVGAEEIVYADVDPEHVAKIRAQYPFLQDRRR